MRGLAALIMQGRFAAMGVVALFALLAPALPPIGYLSGAALALVSLRRGLAEGAVVAVGAAALLAVLGLLAPRLGLPALGVALALWLPVWLLAGLLRRTVSLPLSLEAALAVSLLGLVAAYAAFGDPAREVVMLYHQHLLPELKQMGVAPASVARIEQMLPEVARWIPVGLAIGLWLGWCLSLLLGRAWQAQLYNPGGFGGEFLALRMHRPLATAAALLAAAGIVVPGAMQGLIGDAGLMLVLLFLFQGLAVIHAYLAWRRLHWGWVFGLYAMLVFIPSVLFLLAMLGILDSWRDFRRNMGGAAPK